MSDFDITRATAIINRAIENHQAAVMPESDVDKIAEAERLVQLCKQAADMAKPIISQVGIENIEKYMPKWGAIQAILFEADVTVGSTNGASPAPTPVLPAPQPVAPEPVLAPSAPQPQQQAPVAGLQPTPAPTPAQMTIKREERELHSGDPHPGEVWASENGDHWKVLVYTGGQNAKVKLLSNGEETIVPSGMLKVRISTVTNVETTTEPERPTETPQPTTEPVPAATMVDPSPPVIVEPQELPSTPPTAVPTPPDAPQPEQAQSAPVPDAPPVQGSPPDVADDEQDPRYADLLDEIDRRYTPPGLPVPRDLDNPPDAIPAEDIARADGVDLRRLHAQYNALSSRAKYLYNVEDARARGCHRIASMHLKGPMREARAQLGKDATLAEVRQLADEDGNVALWSERALKHEDKAKAYRMFHEMYAENVVVLSRDGTLRENQARGA
jgi:hypothetical protein